MTICPLLWYCFFKAGNWNIETVVISVVMTISLVASRKTFLIW